MQILKEKLTNNNGDTGGLKVGKTGKQQHPRDLLFVVELGPPDFRKDFISSEELK